MKLTVEKLLSLEAYKEAKIVGGNDGLGNEVSGITIMEDTTINEWLRDGETLLTSLLPLRDYQHDEIINFFNTLTSKKISAIIVKMGKVVNEIPSGLIEWGNNKSIPIIQVPRHVFYTDLMYPAMAEVIESKVNKLTYYKSVHEKFRDMAIRSYPMEMVIETLAEERGQNMKNKDTKNQSKFKAFLAKKEIVISFERYLIDALSYMALGLFATLITGVIFETVGGRLNIPYFVEVLAPKAKAMGGPGIAVAVALGLKAPPLVIFTSVINGFIGYELGGPVGAFLAAVVGAEFGKLASKETPIDIVVTPAVTAIFGSIVGYLAEPGINEFMMGLGLIINKATELQPIPMGMIVAALMGIALTLPISSTAIAIMIAIGGPASGAAVVGGCAHTVGFGIQSLRENGWADLLVRH